MSDAEFNHLLGKAREAKSGGFDAWCCQSTGEKVAVALVLNRPDWLTMMGYTIAEAIVRAGPEWVELIERVERALKDESELEGDPAAGSQIGPEAWAAAGIEAIGDRAETAAQ